MKQHKFLVIVSFSNWKKTVAANIIWFFLTTPFVVTTSMKAHMSMSTNEREKMNGRAQGS
jgi:hypothetical protein